jgi:predicted amidohydrolase YtcJ
METAEEREIVLSGGRVFTSAASGPPWAEALAISGDNVTAVGSVEELTARFPGAKRVNVEGRTVLPGLIDAHNHFLATGESLDSVDVRSPGVASIDDVVDRLAAAARETASGEWVSAFGLDDAKLEHPLTRADLDRASTRHPISVNHVSGHGCVVNSTALAMRAIGRGTPTPPGGQLGRDTAGEPNGVFLDAAMQLILPVALDIGSHGPNFHTEIPLDRSVDLVEQAGNAFVEAGLTTVCDPQVSCRELSAYREARRQGRLPLRTVCMPLSHQLEEFRAVGLAGPFGDDELSIGAMKFYADGSLIAGTAVFSEAYGEHGEFEGLMLHSDDELEELLTAAHLDGWQVGVHVQGDRAMTTVLDILELAIARAPRDHRHRLEHAGYPTPELIERIASLGIIAVNQPNFLHDSGDEFLSRLGARAHGLQPLRSELDAGITVVLSSDSDVSSYEPLETIRNAIARRTLSGAEIGADQALTLEEALRAHTISAAYALRMEDRIGSLEAGKLADITVIDGDLEQTPVEEIASLGIWMTMVGGRPRHAAEATAIESD